MKYLARDRINIQLLIIDVFKLNVVLARNSSKLKTVTWEKDSHGLFDYDSAQLVTHTFKLSNSFRVLRDDVAINISEANAKSSGKTIASVGLLKNNFWVYDRRSAEGEKREEPLMLVLRNYVSDGRPGIRLAQGDIVKLGKCRYIVREIKNGKEESGSFDLCKKAEETEKDCKNKVDAESKAATVNNSEGVISVAEHKSADEMNCRICLCDDNNKENPIISLPCKCLGSVRHIHANCLQEWLKSKVVHQKNDVSTLYSWKDFECEICKTPYPCIFLFNFIGDIIRPDGERIEVLKIEKPKGNYMLFQKVKLPNTADTNSIFTVDLNENREVKIVSAR